MKTIGILFNPEKPNAEKLTEEIVGWLTAKGRTVLVSAAGSRNSRLANCSETRLASDSECILVLGGDGTLLHSARLVASQGTPLCGINMGQLGFLTEIEIKDLEEALEKLIHGEYVIEERMMIEAAVYRKGIERATFYGLNDAVITKGAFARLIRLKTFVDNEFVDTYPADGLIISTATGSTAYSLSAGGPIVMPDMDLMIITPICPHTLTSRPIIIKKEGTVRVELQSVQAEVMLTIDGQSGLQLEPLDEIIVQKAPFNARFIKIHHRSFYEILRKKLKEGRNRDV